MGTKRAAVEVTMSRAAESPIGRRAFLLGAVSLWGAAACAAPVVRTPKEQVAAFPLVDAHSHHIPLGTAPHGYSGDDLVRAMDAAGFHRMIVLGYWDEVPALARRHPGRVVAAYHRLSMRVRIGRGEVTDGRRRDEVERVGSEFDAALRSGQYRGIGEVHTYARPIPFVNAPAVALSPETPVVRRLLEVAGIHGVPIDIHCDSNFSELTRAAAAHRRTTIVWAHMATPMSPSTMRDVLRDHPNVFFDMSAKNPACCPLAAAEHPFLGLGGVLDETWRQLFEAYPDRFLVGVDFFTRDHLVRARETGEFYRNLLGQLTPPTARKLGYENAERLYGLR